MAASCGNGEDPRVREPASGAQQHCESQLVRLQVDMALVKSHLEEMLPDLKQVCSKMHLLDKVESNEVRLERVVTRIEIVEKGALSCPARVAFSDSNLQQGQRTRGNWIAIGALVVASLMALCQVKSVMSGRLQLKELRLEREAFESRLRSRENGARAGSGSGGAAAGVKQPGA